VLPLPDPFRSEFVGPDAAAAYAAAINPTLQKARPAAFIAESIPGVAGQVVPTPGTLAAAFEAAQEVGAVVIADEVQVGFGRTGSAFWGFELADATPDIVTLGKPMGNGHPLGAVVTTGAIAGSFDNGMEYFNSFGGNPVSAAIGMAVLDVIEEEQLQSHSAEVGKRLMEMLAGLGRVDDRVGDVRGAGLFIGVDLVRAGGARSPDPTLAKRLVEHAREHGVLLSTDGPHHNVIKIKPPLVFGHHDAERLTEVIATGLESAARAT
jgi:4-aminobutyrate aminotransferase-like enzyme